MVSKFGTSSGEILDGSSGLESLYGMGGNDTLRGYDSNDYLDGGDGDDRIYGEIGIDTIYSGAGNDVIFIDDAADYLSLADDKINGEGGTDTIYVSSTSTSGSVLVVKLGEVTNVEYLYNLDTTKTLIIEGSGRIDVSGIISLPDQRWCTRPDLGKEHQ